MGNDRASVYPSAEAYIHSFQMKARQSSQDAAIAGATSGKQIRANEHQRPTPSTQAASSSSRGISRNAPVKMIAASGRLNVALAMTRARAASGGDPTPRASAGTSLPAARGPPGQRPEV